MLNNIVSKTEQCRQYNIVQCMLFSTGLQLSLQMPIPQPIFKRNPIAYWSAKETNYNKSGWREEILIIHEMKDPASAAK